MRMDTAGWRSAILQLIDHVVHDLAQSAIFFSFDLIPVTILK